MGKTYKQMPRRMFRHPKYHRQAKQQGARHVPPNPYEDIPFDEQVWMPRRMAHRLIQQGYAAEEAAHKLEAKFKLDYLRALELVEEAVGDPDNYDIADRVSEAVGFELNWTEEIPPPYAVGRPHPPWSFRMGPRWVHNEGHFFCNRDPRGFHPKSHDWRVARYLYVGIRETRFDGARILAFPSCGCHDDHAWRTHTRLGFDPTSSVEEVAELIAPYIQLYMIAR